MTGFMHDSKDLSRVQKDKIIFNDGSVGKKLLKCLQQQIWQVQRIILWQICKHQYKKLLVVKLL